MNFRDCVVYERESKNYINFVIYKTIFFNFVILSCGSSAEKTGSGPILHSMVLSDRVISSSQYWLYTSPNKYLALSGPMAKEDFI